MICSHSYACIHNLEQLCGGERPCFGVSRFERPDPSSPTTMDKLYEVCRVVGQYHVCDGASHLHPER